MASEIGSEPGGVNTIELKLGKELGVRNNVKAFTKVQEAEEGEVAAAHVGEDVVRDGKKGSFSRVPGAEAVL